MTMPGPYEGARIRGYPVPFLVPPDGPVHVLLLGEAPGPRGADKSGFPFFGDRAGLHLYSALERIGAVVLPSELKHLTWDGACFARAGLRPVVRGVALGNAFDHCPTDDGVHFRAPSKSEMESPANVQRLVSSLMQLIERGLTGVVTLGKVAQRAMGLCLTALPSGCRVPGHIPLPHPSAQGLLSMAPNRGKGARLADLEARWISMCEEAVLSLGYRPPDVEDR